MSSNILKNSLIKSSKQDNTWIERAKYRKENKAWLDISFAITVDINHKWMLSSGDLAKRL